MPRAQGRGFMGIFEYQAPATLNQAAPVQNTWYDILAATDFVRVYTVMTNIADANEVIEVEVIVDGETIAPVPINQVAGTDYWWFLRGSAATLIDDIESNNNTGNRRLAPSHLVDGRNVQVRVRKTTAVGVGNLRAIVLYGVLSRVY